MRCAMRCATILSRHLHFGWTTMVMTRNGRISCFMTLTLSWWLCGVIMACCVSPPLALAMGQTTGATGIVENSATKNVVIVGGSSGMGKAAALTTIERGGTVLLVGRTEDKLSNAKMELLEQVPDAGIFTKICDVGDESAVERLAKDLCTTIKTENGERIAWNGLVVSAAGRASHGLVADLPTSCTKDMMESKVWTAYHCAKHIGPILQPNSSVVFVAGILNRRPGLKCAPLAMANGALEGLTRTLALEMGPKTRVNCLSPGFCDTERFDHMDAERKERMLTNTASSLPLQKVGQPSDMGEAIYYLLTAPFCTGVILDVDGGHGIRQYANPTTDPMRNGQQ